MEHVDVESLPVQNLSLDSDYSGDDIILQAQPSNRSVEKKVSSVIDQLLNTLKSVSDEVNGLKEKLLSTSAGSPKRSTAVKATRKDKANKINKSCIKPEYHNLILLEEFTEAQLATSIKLLFQDGVLLPNVNYSQIAITDEEFNNHMIACSDPEMYGHRITDKDIPTLIKRMFLPIGKYSIETSSGEIVSLNVGDFVGMPRHVIMDTLQKGRWIQYIFDKENQFRVSPYTLEFFDNIPACKHLNLTKNADHYAIFDNFLKLIDLIRNDHVIYKEYFKSDSGDQYLKVINATLINGKYFKPEALIALAKEKKSTFKNSKEVDKMIRVLTNTQVEDHLIC